MVKKLSINNAKATGTFATATESWTNVSGEKNYDFTTAAEATEAEGTVVSEPSYLFPTEEETQYNATFEIELILEDAVSKTPVTIDTYEHSVTLPGFTFDKGYSYAFKTVVNAENINPEEEQYPINFTAEVEVWGEESEGNFNLKDDQVKE